MNTKGTAAISARAIKLSLACVLVALLFVSALASASAALHGWLHTDHHSSTHYCLVSALQHSQAHTVDVAVATAPTPIQFEVSPGHFQLIFASQDVALYRERGPPVLS